MAFRWLWLVPLTLLSTFLTAVILFGLVLTPIAGLFSGTVFPWTDFLPGLGFVVAGVLVWVGFLVNVLPLRRHHLKQIGAALALTGALVQIFAYLPDDAGAAWHLVNAALLGLPTLAPSSRPAPPQ